MITILIIGLGATSGKDIFRIPINSRTALITFLSFLVMLSFFRGGMLAGIKPEIPIEFEQGTMDLYQSWSMAGFVLACFATLRVNSGGLIIPNEMSNRFLRSFPEFIILFNITYVLIQFLLIRSGFLPF